MLPAFLISVGIGDSVHLQSIYRDLRRDGFDNRAAILQATALTGKPILILGRQIDVSLPSEALKKGVQQRPLPPP